MKKIRRKLLVMAMALILLVGILPTSAFAENDAPATGTDIRSDAVSEFTYVAPEISGSGMGFVDVYVEDSQSNEGWPGWRLLEPGDKIDASKGLRIRVPIYCSFHKSIKLQIGTGSGSSFTLVESETVVRNLPGDDLVYTVNGLNRFTNSGGDLLRVSAEIEFDLAFGGVCHILEKDTTGAGTMSLYDDVFHIELKRGWEGDPIEAYVVPDEGYTLSGLYLLKRDDPLPTENFEITSDFNYISNGRYTFTMPDHSAKVYAVFELESAHSHRWNYRSEGGQIIASCGCGKQPRLSLFARGHFYNGEKGEAWLNLDQWNFTGDGEPLIPVSDADIVYGANPEKAGNHTVTLTVGGATAEATYTINKAREGIYVIDQSYFYDGELHGPGVITCTDPDEIAKYVIVSTLRNGDKLASVTIEGQGKEIGEYPLKITDYRIENAKGEDVSENYDVGCYDGTLHIDTTATKYNLWVGGIRVTSDNAADIFGNGDVGATAIYSHSTKTLILNNCYYEGKGYKYGDNGDVGFYAAIHAEDQDLTILLLGANTIKNTAASTDVGAGIYIYKGGLTIEGTGTLTATGNSKNDDGGIGICTVLGDITINGGTVTASGIDGIAADGDNRKLKVNGGTVIAIGSDRGISAADVIIADGMAVIAGDSEETAIDVDKTIFETDHSQEWVKIAPAGSTPTHTVNVTITGNTASADYDGTEKSVSGFSFTAKDSDDGDVSGVTVTLKSAYADAASIVKTNAGEYDMGLKAEYFEVTLPDGYTLGTVTVKDGKLTIAPADASDFEVIIEPESVEYNGKPWTFVAGLADLGQNKTSVAVAKYPSSRPLESPKDFTLSWSDSTDAGTVTVTATMQGNYTGTIEKTFTIKKASIDATTITPPAARTLRYTGAEQELVTPGACPYGELRYCPKTDGTIEPDITKWTTTPPKATEVGTYTVRWVVYGDQNHNIYSATAPVTVEISPAPQPTAISYAAKDGSGNTTQSVTWQKGSGKNLDLTFKRSEDDHLTYRLFGSLEIGGVTVGSANYGASEGSLKLSVKPEYLETLSVGDHTVKVNFQDGSATMKLTVLAASAQPTPSPTPKPSEKPASPKTGDENSMMWWLLCLSASAVALWITTRRKMRQK